MNRRELLLALSALTIAAPVMASTGAAHRATLSILGEDPYALAVIATTVDWIFGNPYAGVIVAKASTPNIMRNNAWLSMEWREDIGKRSSAPTSEYWNGVAWSCRAGDQIMLGLRNDWPLVDWRVPKTLRVEIHRLDPIVFGRPYVERDPEVWEWRA